MAASRQVNEVRDGVPRDEGRARTPLKDPQQFGGGRGIGLTIQDQIEDYVEVKQQRHKYFFAGRR